MGKVKVSKKLGIIFLWRTVASMHTADFRERLAWKQQFAGLRKVFNKWLNNATK